MAAADSGVFDWSAAVELADVVAGHAHGRRDNADVILFKSVGLAIEDVALGSRIVGRARHAGMGSPLPW